MGGHQGGGAYGGGYQGGGGFQGKELDVSLDVVLDDIEILKSSIRDQKVQGLPSSAPHSFCVAVLIQATIFMRMLWPVHIHKSMKHISRIAIRDATSTCQVWLTKRKWCCRKP